jgi:pimeloyl-ACP methyl ester carboxylesterase
MNHPPNTPEKRGHILMSFGLALVLFGSCGCAAHLATVKTKAPRLSATVAREAYLGPATEFLAAAENEQPLSALGHDLLAARISCNVLERFPNNESARNIYNFSVARIVQDTERAGIEPWRHPINIGTDEGKYVFSSPKPADADHDPSRYDLYPTDTLKISGRFFKTSSRVSGIGAPLVAVGREENPQFRQQYKLRRVYAPATAVIQFSGQKADLKFVDPFQAERVALGKRNFPLAVDLSAPTAMLIARERPERLGFAGVIDPQRYADTARLTQLQPFDPARTPVIFVHGLQETPASWTPMIDSLRNDPRLREHYQFWVYSYPSGYPYPYSAALFRQDLDGIDRAFPDHKRIVLIGHSMGGMICRLMITDGGDKIWHDFFATSPAKTPLSSDTRKLLEKSLVFNHRPDVQRVIFISTPHRGSRLASGWIGRIGAALVRTPRLFTSVYASTKPLLVSDPAARTLKRMPNSVDTLEPNDRFVQAVDKLPMTRSIPYHSIMGDRGRGNTPNSSDGIVPYWSSHVDGAQSELIVDSGHDAQTNPKAIKEVDRILKVSLARGND